MSSSEVILPPGVEQAIRTLRDSMRARNDEDARELELCQRLVAILTQIVNTPVLAADPSVCCAVRETLQAIQRA